MAMHQFYQIFICLLEFAFFCFVGVTMQVYTSFLIIDGMPPALYRRPSD
jgi:hypothetical protein